MKAQALKHNVAEISATELAKRSEELDEIIGYRVGKRRKIIPLTLKEFTGSKDECLFSQELSSERVHEFFRAKRKIRITEKFVIATRVASLAVSGGMGLMFLVHVFDNEFKDLGFLLGEALLSLIALFYPLIDECGFNLSRRVSKRSYKIIEEAMPVNSAQGLTSILTGEQFELRSPNAASLREAMVLLKEANTLKEKLDSLKGHKQGRGALEDELTRIQEALTKTNETMEKIRLLEEHISEILHREER